jgi:hypothetical protein
VGRGAKAREAVESHQAGEGCAVVMHPHYSATRKKGWEGGVERWMGSGAWIPKVFLYSKKMVYEQKDSLFLCYFFCFCRDPALIPLPANSQVTAVVGIFCQI